MSNRQEEPLASIESGGRGGPGASRRRAARAVGVGLLLVATFGLLTLSPLLLGRGSLNRFIVVVGLVGVLVGGSCAIHGAWDWVIARRG